MVMLHQPSSFLKNEINLANRGRIAENLCKIHVFLEKNRAISYIFAQNPRQLDSLLHDASQQILDCYIDYQQLF